MKNLITKDSRRSTRVEKRTADLLDEAALDLGIKSAAIDRQILEFAAGLIGEHRRRGESLTYFFYRILSK